MKPILCFFLICLLYPAVSEAQNIRAAAIELTVVGQSGETALPTLPAFISNTRNPDYFRVQDQALINRDGSFTKEGFSILFHFSDLRNEHFRWLAGFSYNDVHTNLYTFTNQETDSLSFDGRLDSRTELFFIHIGLHYETKPQARFTLIAGGLVQFGIPVSAKTTESLTTGNNPYPLNYGFYAKESLSAGLSIPIGIRFKVLHTFSISLLAKPGLYYSELDGNPVLNRFGGTNLGFHFKLRQK